MSFNVFKLIRNMHRLIKQEQLSFALHIVGLVLFVTSICFILFLIAVPYLFASNINPWLWVSAGLAALLVNWISNWMHPVAQLERKLAKKAIAQHKLENQWFWRP